MEVPKEVNTLSELPPPLHVLTEDEVIQALWTGSKSIVRRLVRYVSKAVEAHKQDKTVKERLNKAKADDVSDIVQQMRTYFETAIVSVALCAKLQLCSPSVLCRSILQLTLKALCER